MPIDSNHIAPNPAPGHPHAARRVPGAGPDTPTPLVAGGQGRSAVHAVLDAYVVALSLAAFIGVTVVGIALRGVSCVY